MGLIVIIFLICVIFAAIYSSHAKRKEQALIEQVTSPYRGESSERNVILELLKMGINPKAIFHDLYIQKPNGEYTQVDIAVATKVGIIVFEVKDYSGWIFGNEHQKYWTQVLAYGRVKHRFYNPIAQNAGHIHTIRKCLPQNPGIPIYSVIVFFGNCVLKDVTYDTKNTFIIHPGNIMNLVSNILTHPDANYGNKYEIMDLFTKAAQNGNDPIIVSSQINSAEYYGMYKPQSTYRNSFTPSYHFRFRIFRRRKKFW